MGHFILYVLATTLPYLLAVAAQAVLCILAVKRGWRGFTRLLLPAALAAAGLVLFVLWLVREPGWTAGHTAGENAVTLLARLFILLLPALLALAVAGIARFRPGGVKALLVLLMVGLIPFSASMLDGGTVTHFALLYRIDFLHRLEDTLPGGFRTGAEVRVFPFNWMGDD